MPLVRCPDCFRDIEVSQEDLAGIIECAACEARFGPLMPRPGASAPLPLRDPAEPWPPPFMPGTEFEYADGQYVERLKNSSRKLIKPKSLTRFIPVLLGILIGLGGTAAVAGSIYVALKYGLQSGPPAPSTPAPARRPPGNPGR